METSFGEASTNGVYSSSKASKFEFKDKSRRRRHREKDESERTSSKHHRSDNYSDSRHRHRDKRRKYKYRRVDDETKFPRTGDYDNPDYRYRESLYDGIGEDADHGLPQIDPDTAFREAIFDAMADDEGAQYWEGIYGQPIHVYSKEKAGPQGELERMTDEEYVDYVRRKMWEKSHEHILEEREAKERARQKRRQQRDHLEQGIEEEEKERERVRQQMQESLKRGEKRKKAKEAEVAWSKYLAKWEELKAIKDPDNEDTEVDPRNLIPWPGASGKWKHMDKEDIERFLKDSPSWRDDPTALLKTERVRWHPDKMQQRFGRHIDAETMKSVTAVFQVVDRLWGERRG